MTVIADEQRLERRTAVRGYRTLMACLEGRNFTIKLYPRKRARFNAGGPRRSTPKLSRFPGGDPSSTPGNNPRKPVRKPEARPIRNHSRRLTDNREEIFADRAVHGKCAAAETEEG